MKFLSMSSRTPAVIMSDFSYGSDPCRNLKKFGPVVSEDKSFERVDGRRRTTMGDRKRCLPSVLAHPGPLARMS